VNLEVLNRQIVSCTKCPRLVDWRESVGRQKRRAYQDWTYWSKPVPGFGDAGARVLVVGLAPGAHGSNRTGRQFTGDASGNFLFPALHRAGFASQPVSVSRDDGLRLLDLYITASARCAPPGNRPTSVELENCQPYLETEIELLHPSVVVCLGRIAFERILRIFGFPPSTFRFSHGASFRVKVPGRDTSCWLLASYHPSQQNTSTGRLTRPMFDKVWRLASKLADHG
jgi:uracil-DNA glycosylase family 4